MKNNPSVLNQPIGVFDSGVGGLTVLKALRERLPNETLIYLGDTARLPYGTKSAAAVSAYAMEAAKALVALGIKALVVADNTSSAHALDGLRAQFTGLPVIGVVEPGAQAAGFASARGKILVLATESTVRAGIYPRAILNTRPGASVSQLACPLFVSMAEEGIIDGPIAEQVARHYLTPFFPEVLDDLDEDGKGADCLLLGCTHFPALVPMLRHVLGPDVVIVDSATTTARAVEDLLDNRGLAAAPKPAPAPVRYLATDAPERFARVAQVFVPWSIDPAEIQIIDLVHQ